MTTDALGLSTTDLEALQHPSTPTVQVPRLQRLPGRRLTFAEWRDSAPFLSVHLVAVVGAFVWPPTWGLVALCLGLYYLRILAITLAYHRYFAHRAFKTSRAFQLILAVWAMTSAQRGALWWAGHHRNHHRYSDTPKDLHSPARSGFFWSHVGWILSHENGDAPLDVIQDMAKYPELRWLERHEYLPAIALGAVVFLLGGLPALIWGFFVSTVLLWHGTFTINSLSHVFGTRRYPTTDTSRNNPWLTVITLGEGWHNNHHYFCSSARLGFRWWEIDPTWYIVLLLERAGVIWDVKRPAARVYAESAAG